MFVLISDVNTVLEVGIGFDFGVVLSLVEISNEPVLSSFLASSLLFDSFPLVLFLSTLLLRCCGIGVVSFEGFGIRTVKFLVFVVFLH